MSPPNLSPNELKAMVHTGLHRHYQGLLDQPIAMLGEVSPRAAVQTEEGRGKVAAWIKALENHLANVDDRDDALATYDASWLWTELGVAELRR